MDSFLWWSGVAAWAVLAAAGALALGEAAINWAADVLYVKREFLAFVAARLRAKQPRP